MLTFPISCLWLLVSLIFVAEINEHFSVMMCFVTKATLMDRIALLYLKI